MGDGTKIEWTDATWTPIRARRWEQMNDGSARERKGWHCERVSEGCRNCYAERMNLRGIGTGLDFKPGHIRRKGKGGLPTGAVEIFLDDNMLRRPMSWRRSRRIFVCSMTDLFGDWVPDDYIDQVFAVMAHCTQHTFQVLTKRPARMRHYLIGLPKRIDDWSCNSALDFIGDLPLPNVWVGTSVEDQAAADARIPELIATPAAVRFLSCEPLLGPVDLGLGRGYCRACGQMTSGSIAGHCMDPASPCFAGETTLDALIHQVIVGGESGPGARPMHPDWARGIRDHCAFNGVPFFFKQHGEWVPLAANGGGFWPTDGGGCIRLAADGRRSDDGWPMQRVGKKAAGRLLDGVPHDGTPS